MEYLNGRPYFPMHHENLNHNFAIRRFCSERIEQEQGQGRWEEEDETLVLEIDPHCSPSDHTRPRLDASEVDDFVDSFINMDDHHDNIKRDDANKLLMEEINEGDCTPLEHSKVDFGEFSFSMEANKEQGDQIPFLINGTVKDEAMNIDPSSSSQDSEIVQGVLVEEAPGEEAVDQGLHLVHSLLACAEAIGCRDIQLAETLLARIWGSVTPLGNSLQRVAYCFAVGLKSRLSLLHNVNTNGTFPTTTSAKAASLPYGARPSITREEKMEAFRLLHQTTPYIAFGHMAANEAIHQAAQGQHLLHIIDLGIHHTLLQWPSLFRTLASRPEGPPQSIRITGLTDDPDHTPEIESSMRSLAHEATSLGIAAFEFRIVTDPPTPSLFTREKLRLEQDEIVLVNSILQLHQYVRESRGSLKSILQAIKKLGPAILTVIEQDANHNGPFFLGRFLESLHYYSAVFDSLEATLARQSAQRMKIERTHYTEEIRNVVACEGWERRERHERANQWRRQLGRSGFHGVSLGKCVSRARMMLSVYGCDGYTLGSEKGCLLLGWKGRNIMLASAWQASSPPQSSPPPPLP